MPDLPAFRLEFEALTGNSPFPWQEEFYRKLMSGRVPSRCDIPTGLGKTAVIAIWLIALAHSAENGTSEARVPRRLVYIVNRRTVVDQATSETEKMRARLIAEDRPSLLAQLADRLAKLAADPSAGPLAISTLRGQFADNGDWRADPARPAVVVGTVDMIGSRLLFSGYGCGFKSRPLHAGFLGQDSLIVHDEAHLEPAFQELLRAIEAEQERCKESRRMRVMEMTATSRGDDENQVGLSEKDLAHRVVKQRLGAKKTVFFHEVDDEKKVADRTAELALEYKDSGQAILVFLRQLKDVETVVDKLRKARMQFEQLTGTLRGKERDELVTQPVFRRFLPRTDAGEAEDAAAGTVYLVCTSAGEVGVNISADHLVCDLTPFDSMAQRFGRVNRFGDGAARIDIVHPVVFEEKNEYEVRRRKTLDLLRRLTNGTGGGDASPASLRDLPPEERQQAFAPRPVILPVSDILFDAWALTSISPPLVRESLPGRPSVDPYLHGVSGWEPPETHVAWREEVGIITDDLREKYPPEDLLEGYPLKPHELLRDRTDRVFKHLANLAKRQGDAPVWVIDRRERLWVATLGEVAESGMEAINGATIVLPPKAGGLNKGMLDGSATFDKMRTGYDVADESFDEAAHRRRQRLWDAPAPDRMRLVCEIDTRPEADDEEAEEEERAEMAAPRYWRWYVQPRSADDDGSQSARKPQELAVHNTAAGGFAQRILGALGIAPSPETTAVLLAAKWHDLGKGRSVWQKSIRNGEYPSTVLAKSGNNRPPIGLNSYRHEFGSLLDILHGRDGTPRDPEFTGQVDEIRELTLHLIAAHHGRARPHFPAIETFDPEVRDNFATKVAREVPRRFARLQRKYGRWGLAYLESLVRAADILASISKEDSQ